MSIETAIPALLASMTNISESLFGSLRIRTSMKTPMREKSDMTRSCSVIAGSIVRTSCTPTTKSP